MNVTKYEWMYFLIGMLIGFAVGWFVFGGGMQRVIPQAEAKACKGVNAECKTNESDKLCCSDLQCVNKDGVPSEIGKCQPLPTATPVPPTATPIPTIVIPTIVVPTITIPRITCHTEILGCCKDAEFLGTKCPRKWKEGACPTPTPPVEEPTATPSPTLEPTLAPVREATVSSGGGGGQPSAPSACIPRSMIIHPTVWGVGRLDSDTVWARWTNADEGITDYVVWYGLKDGDYRWNTFVKGNYVELNGVPNTHIWIAVQATDNCGVGPMSVMIDP